MSYYVQQMGKTGKWASEDFEFDSVDSAKQHANRIFVGTDPCVLRIVDDQSVVCGWVPRNGYRPGGALPPQR